MPSQWHTISTAYVEEDPVPRKSRSRNRAPRLKPSLSTSPVKRPTRTLPDVKVYEDIYDARSGEAVASGEPTLFPDDGPDLPYSDQAFIPFDNRTSQGKVSKHGSSDHL